MDVTYGLTYYIMVFKKTYFGWILSNKEWPAGETPMVFFFLNCFFFVKTHGFFIVTQSTNPAKCAFFGL